MARHDKSRPPRKEKKPQIKPRSPPPPQIEEGLAGVGDVMDGIVLQEVAGRESNSGTFRDFSTITDTHVKDYLLILKSNYRMAKDSKAFKHFESFRTALFAATKGEINVGNGHCTSEEVEKFLELNKSYDAFGERLRLFQQDLQDERKAIINKLAERYQVLLIMRDSTPPTDFAGYRARYNANLAIEWGVYQDINEALRYLRLVCQKCRDDVCHFNVRLADDYEPGEAAGDQQVLTLEMY